MVKRSAQRGANWVFLLALLPTLSPALGLCTRPAKPEAHTPVPLRPPQFFFFSRRHSLDVGLTVHFHLFLFLLGACVGEQRASVDSSVQPYLHQRH